MNPNQSENVRVLTPDIVKILKGRQWRDASTALLKCTGCGRTNITGPIVAFFKFRGENLLCYECQKMVPQPKETAQKAPVPNMIERARTWENRDDKITEKQKTLLRSLLLEKVVDEVQREERLSGLAELTKQEARTAINLLINQV